jgi:hypothetical protein
MTIGLGETPKSEINTPEENINSNELTNGNVILQHIVNYLNTHGKVQIGTLSGELTSRGMLTQLQAVGGLKKFLLNAGKQPVIFACNFYTIF